ncbi:permease [Methylocystis heyeri]|uniref:Permease n=1 Tax=Methylocystis heyeri TaxID=391905 RepID=A0A6B8KDL2_9HYPH|nr:permease [Methylocystis heyeri]QGM46534.1 permease [Methylocystis heyeri]
MSAPGSILWFAAHEARLAWRDWLLLMTAGRRRRVGVAALGFGAFVLFLHGVAYLALSRSERAPGASDAGLLVFVAGTLALSFSAMLSQAMESVTRAFYARGDLELILTSPARSARLFAVRIAAIAATICSMSLVFAAPFINVQAWLAGPRWLSAYLVAAALSMLAAAVAIVIVGALFVAIGARRTRLISQIVAAVIGAAFAIGLQFAAIVSFGTIAAPRFAVLERLALEPDSALLWPARAAFGDPAALALLLGVGATALGAVIAVFAPRFGELAIAAGGASFAVSKKHRRSERFGSSSPAQALRRKEWTLLLRDPWLMSQTLMQLLYLLPAAFLLWRSFFSESGVATFLAPVLIMSAGQLGGGLAWLAVSGEDAPELIATAPVAASHVLRAKAEAVLVGIGAVFIPLVLMLATVSLRAALVSMAGVILAAGSATAIQYWFRAQAKRSHFRRRQTSSRIATFAEAISSNGWAGVGALAAMGSWLAVAPAVIVVAILVVVWALSPARASA